MSRLIFKIDKEKDIRNAWELCNTNIPYLENEGKKQLDTIYKNLWRGRNFDKCKKEIGEYIGSLYSSEIMDIFKEGVEKAWGKINETYFKRLENITKKPICTNEFTVYPTSVGRCSYDIKDFSLTVSIRRPLLQCLRTVGHELLHLQFHSYYWKLLESKIGKEKAIDLNESLTILLNSEFEDLWLVKDEGYPPHQELRKFITTEWEKEKDFDILLDKCVIYLSHK
jgi:hypothetical protein